MAKTKKNRYSGIMVYFNQYPLSRVNSLSIDTDLNEEEIREIGNEEIVERVDQTPTVTITIDTNEYADIKNLRYLVGQSGGNILVSSFDGPTVDVVMAVEEDNVYTKTALVNNAVPVSVSWNFDVGGLATESYNLEGDNFTWFSNKEKVIRVLTATGVNAAATIATFDPWPWFSGATSPNNLETNINGSGWVPIKLYVDGILYETGYGGNQAVQASSYSGGQLMCTNTNPTTPSLTNRGSIQLRVTGGIAFAGSGGTNWRLILVESGSFQTRLTGYTNWGTTVTTGVGGVSKGMIDILMVTGTQAFGAQTPRSTTFLRCQTISIDMDLSRESLEELGHDRAYEKALTLPVPVNITFNTLANDLEDFAKFAGQVYTSISEVNLSDFVKTASVEVRVWNTKDTATTQGSLNKLVRITGLDISTQSYSVDVGGNATQDFTATASNILVSGSNTISLQGLGR